MASILKIREHLDSIISYLTPLLPVANCHMVEFFTQNLWERHLPGALRSVLDSTELDDAVEKFWSTAGDHENNDTCELSKWICKARSHCITVNNDYCLSVEQIKDRIKSWGGDIRPEIRVKGFMCSKKSYEVQTMSSLVASLHTACASTCCIEAGGGRGHLPVALCLGYGVPSLTIDCNERTLKSAADRVNIIQKQWHGIAKRINDGNEVQMSSIYKGLHRFAGVYVTGDTDLAAIVKEKFPEHAESDMRLLLTGLHTCGNLGPDSLRIFISQPSIAAVFNVPCCYNQLTENIDVNIFNTFQRNYGCGQETGQGFPLSAHLLLKGYNLGRNLRMLATQSIDRVVNQRQLPPKSLLYRALLEAIIKKHRPNLIVTEGKLKGIGLKCQDFKEYFKMADAILQLDLYDSLPDSYLTDTYKDMGCQWKKIVLFYFLRLSLAQVIESVILLDRLLFLVENGFHNVYLVKLFDPVLSPRCHSIVAIR